MSAAVGVGLVNASRAWGVRAQNAEAALQQIDPPSTLGSGTPVAPLNEKPGAPSPSISMHDTNDDSRHHSTGASFWIILISLVVIAVVVLFFVVRISMQVRKDTAALDVLMGVEHGAPALESDNPDFINTDREIAFAHNVS